MPPMNTTELPPLPPLAAALERLRRPRPPAAEADFLRVLPEPALSIEPEPAAAAPQAEPFTRPPDRRTYWFDL